MGFWVEIVTLLIPGFNDSRDELTRLTAFVAGVSPDIPWHVTAFHGDYKMTDPENTTAEMLLQRGGDRRGATGCATSTPATCPAASAIWRTPLRGVLVERYGYQIRDYRVTPDGRCPSCAAPVPGRWSAQFDGQIAATRFCREPGACGRILTPHRFFLYCRRPTQPVNR